MESNYVWVVNILADDTPTLLSVHTSMEKANAARKAYIDDYRFGGTESDYWVQAVKLDWIGVNND